MAAFLFGINTCYLYSIMLYLFQLRNTKRIGDIKMINFLNEKHAAYNLKESVRHMNSYKKLIQLERQAATINRNILNSYIQLYVKYYKVNVSAKSYLNMI